MILRSHSCLFFFLTYSPYFIYLFIYQFNLVPQVPHTLVPSILKALYILSCCSFGENTDENQAIFELKISLALLPF